MAARGGFLGTSVRRKKGKRAVGAQTEGEMGLGSPRGWTSKVLIHGRELGFNPGGHGKSDLIRGDAGDPSDSGREEDQRGVGGRRGFQCVSV